MSIICITGQSQLHLKGVEQILLDCGMASHRPLQRDPTFNLLKWHDRVQASSGVTQSKQIDGGLRAAHPSRMWEQLAVDLIVANMDSSTWGWAHTDSVELLDFWSQLESDLRFVLVCEDRTLLICNLIAQGETAQSITRHMEIWQRLHQSMLRFHLRNPEISIMVWASEVQTQPAHFIQKLNEVLQTSLQMDLDSRQAPSAPN